MKALLLVSILALSSMSHAMAATPNYRCIADSLQAYNSDIFYNLSPAEIDTMLNDSAEYGHDLALDVAKRCEAQ